MISSENGWKFDSDGQQYIRPNGKKLPAEELRKVVHAFIQNIERKFRIIGGAAGYSKDKHWFVKNMLKFLTPLFLAMALLAVGGEREFNAADGQILSGEDEHGTPYAIERLMQFAEEIADGKYDGKENALMSRSAMYSSGPWLLFSALREMHAIAVGMKFERNVLDSSVTDHCKTDAHGPHAGIVGCTNETKRGIVPIGSLVKIGQRRCNFRCRCSMAYSR